LQEKKLVHSTKESLSRLAEAKAEVALATSPAAASHHVRSLTKPNSPSSTMKKVGVALIAAPDPFTGVAGVALVASSYAVKRNEPANLEHLAQETRKILRDLGSLTL
jgi:hypothetical protein